MIVCVCHRVSDHTIRRCGREGGCFDTLQFEYGVATQCGQCECSARALLDEARGESVAACAARAPSHAPLTPLPAHTPLRRYPVIALQPAWAA